MAVAAQFDILPKGDNQRGTARHQIRLRVRGGAVSGETSDVLILNLSTSGMLLESSAQLTVGDEIAVDLPEAEKSVARVVWASGQFFGCAFERPLSTAAASAAQLRSEPTQPEQSVARAGDTKAETFGARLQRLRREKGLTLVEFARLTKVSRPTIWSWEADRSTPRRSKTKILLEVLGITEDELFGTVGFAEHRIAGGASSRDDALRHAVNEAKKRVAELVGTHPDKVTFIIEV